MWAWFWFVAFIVTLFFMICYRQTAEVYWLQNCMLADMIREERDKHKEVE